jgi:hypothetical protein
MQKDMLAQRIAAAPGWVPLVDAAAKVARLRSDSSYFFLRSASGAISEETRFADLMVRTIGRDDLPAASAKLAKAEAELCSQVEAIIRDGLFEMVMEALAAAGIEGENHANA